jgi:hypothetical protein
MSDDDAFSFEAWEEVEEERAAELAEALEDGPEIEVGVSRDEVDPAVAAALAKRPYADATLDDLVRAQKGDAEHGSRVWARDEVRPDGLRGRPIPGVTYRHEIKLPVRGADLGPRRGSVLGQPTSPTASPQRQAVRDGDGRWLRLGNDRDAIRSFLTSAAEETSPYTFELMCESAKREGQPSAADAASRRAIVAALARILADAHDLGASMEALRQVVGVRTKSTISRWLTIGRAVRQALPRNGTETASSK